MCVFECVCVRERASYMRVTSKYHYTFSINTLESGLLWTLFGGIT